MRKIRLKVAWQFYSKGHVFDVGINGMPAAHAETLVRGQMAEYVQDEPPPTPPRRARRPAAAALDF